MKDNMTTALIAMLGFIVFSFGDAGIKLGSVGFSTFQVAATVTSVSLSLTIVYMWKQGVLTSPAPKKPGLMILRSCLKLAQIPCLFYAFANFPMSIVYAAIFAMPLGTNALNSIFLGEKIGPRRVAAICIGFGGVLIALNPSKVEIELGHLTLLILVAAGAADSVIVRMTAPHEPLSLMNFWPSLNAIIVMGFLSIEDFKPMPVETLSILIGTGFAGFLGGICYMHALRRGPVVSASSMQYSQVIWGGAIGYFVFNESMTLMTLVGSVIITVCGLYIMLRKDGVKPAPSAQTLLDQGITSGTI